MISRFLVFFLLLSSCGPNIRLKENKLESISPLSPSQMASFQKEGVLLKGGQNEVQYDGRTYLVSKYSSKESEVFISSLPMGSSVPVIFTGGLSGNQIVIETIKRR